MTRKFTFTILAMLFAILGPGAEAWGQTENLLCGGSFIGSFPNSESWIGSDVDYYSGNGYKLDTDETLQSPDIVAGVKKVTIKILVGHNGGATSTLKVGAYSSADAELAMSNNIVPTVAYDKQTDAAIQEFTLDGGTTDIKYIKLSFKKVKNYGMKTLEVYNATSTPSAELESIAISGTPNKTTYEAGEEFDPAGLKVMGTYKNQTDPEEITSGITWSSTPNPLTAGTTSVSVTATVDGKSDTKNYDVTVNAIEGDRLTLASTGVSGSSYTAWSGKTGSEGVAVYAGKSAGSNNAIQLNNTNPNGIVSTTSAGLIKKVKVDWESHTSDGRYITIYGSNTAYTSSADVYDTEKQGTSLGTIKKGTNTELTITEDYAYVGVKANGALYMNSITFIWSAPKELVSIAVKTAPTAVNYAAGEFFNPAGLVITATYDDASTADIAYEGNEDKFSFSPALDVALATTDEQVTITYGGKSCNQTITVKNIELTSIVVSGDLATTEYTEGDDFDFTGLVATGYYSDETNKVITDQVEWSIDPATLTAGQTSVKVIATMNEISGDKTYDITVAAAPLEVTWDASQQGYSNEQAVTEAEFNAIINAEFEDGKYYNTGTAVRVYKEKTFAIHATSGYKITSIVIGFGEGDNSNTITADCGTYSSGTWTGSAKDVTFTVGGTSGHRRLKTFTVTYAVAAPAVATPTITPNGGEFIGSQEITLACTTEGATISYTTDDWETSNTYSTPFTINETTTIKAKANKDGMSESEVATATFTKIPVLETMQAIFDASATAGNYYVTFNNWVVSGVKGSNAYITDGEKGFIVYKSDHGFKAGDVISGTAQLALTRYKGAAEFTNLTATTQGIYVTEGETVTPVEMNIADLGGVNTGAVITVNNVEYTGSQIFSDGENNITAYNAFMTLPSFTNGDSYNLTGVYIQYNNTKEIAPRDANDIVLIVDAPTFDPEGGDYNAAQTVEITSATTGATIYYTLDKSNPTTGSTPYTDPIEISENTTIKAIAVKNGVSSEIATAVYNITITTVATPTFEPEDGSYFDEDLKVSLACATDGATIVYTTDDWSTQTPYSDPFTITETTTVKAKATKAAMDESEIAEATYTKRYKVDYVVNGDATAVASVYVTPGEAIGTLPTLDDIVIPTGFEFAGWSSSESSTATIGETYIVNADVTLYAVFSREEGGTPGSGNYEKVTAQLTDWRGDYLIAYSDEVFMDGSLAGGTNGVGKAQTHVSPESALSGNTISAAWGNEHHVTIEAIDDTDLTKGYVIKSHSTTTPYFYQTSNSNGMAGTENKSTAATYPITITLNTENDVRIALGGKATGAVLRYNNTSGSTGEMFRYYKNCGQQPIYLYKKDAGAPGTTHYYTRVFSNETATAAITIAGPTIIPAGSILNMGSFKLSNDNAANLVIEDGGQLIVNNKGVQATMKKHIKNTPSSDDPARSWYTISSPLAASVNVTDVTNLIPGNNIAAKTYDLYRLNEAEGIWENARPETDQEPAFTTIDKGCGYIYANNAGADHIAFAGEINVADVECNLTNGAAHGFNLIGNPFTQNIKLTDVKSGGTAELAGGFYVLTNQDTWGTEPSFGTIAPLQGFLVQATTEVTATISKPTAAPSKGERSEQNTNIEMIVSNSIYRDNAFAMFGEGTGLNKVSHRNAQAPMLYVPQDGEDFAIAFMDENTTVFPVSFKAMTTGSYSISLKPTDDVSTLVLVDNMTGEETNMLLEDSYTFIGSPADNENRFTVKLKISNSQDEDEHFAYQNGNELVINGEGTLQIFDVLGRVVVSEEVHGQTVNVGGLNTGAYIVRLTGESVKTQKIVVR